MKKLLLVVGFPILLFCFSSLGDTMDDWNKERLANGFYDGDPNKNQILESTENYIVIRNETANPRIYINVMDDFEAANVFQAEAWIHCQKNKFFSKAYHTASISLDEHTSYHVC